MGSRRCPRSSAPGDRWRCRHPIPGMWTTCLGEDAWASRYRLRRSEAHALWSRSGCCWSGPQLEACRCLVRPRPAPNRGPRQRGPAGRAALVAPADPLRHRDAGGLAVVRDLRPASSSGVDGRVCDARRRSAAAERAPRRARRSRRGHPRSARLLRHLETTGRRRSRP